MLPTSRPSSHALLTRGQFANGRRRLLLGAGGMAVTLAMLLPGQAMAGTYTAGTESELQTAIANANADADASATITLTSNFSVSSTALPGATKPITIDTAGFTLSGSGSSIIISGNSTTTGTLTLNGTILGNSTGTAGTALSLSTGGNVVSTATITGGNQSAANVAGTNGVALSASQSFSNNGTITGGSAIAYTGGAAGAGAGLTLSSGGALTNAASGTIQGGSSAAPEPARAFT